MSVPGPADELPPPSAELVLICTLTQAFLKRLPKKEREAFLHDAAEILRLQDDFANVIRLRPGADSAAVDAEVRRAAEWFRRALPMLLARCA